VDFTTKFSHVIVKPEVKGNSAKQKKAKNRYQKLKERNFK